MVVVLTVKSMDDMMKEEPVVTAARINARHAVVVAVITAIATLAVAYVADHRETPPASNQRTGEMRAAVIPASTSSSQDPAHTAGTAESAGAKKDIWDRLQVAEARVRELEATNSRLRDELATSKRTLSSSVNVSDRKTDAETRALRNTIDSLNVQNATLGNDLARTRADLGTQINNLRASNDSLRAETSRLRGQVVRAESMFPFADYKKYGIAPAKCIPVAHEVMASLNASEVRRDDEIVTGRYSDDYVSVQCGDGLVFFTATTASHAKGYLTTLILKQRFDKYSTE